jgi:S1-C subfamily serine protease
VIRSTPVWRYNCCMATSPLSAFSSELTDIVERASAFVVAVDARHRRPGSGIIFGRDLIVTADHVLEREEDVAVRVGDRRLAATIAGRDPASDVAVLRVQELNGSDAPRGGAAKPGQLAISVSRTGSGGVSAAVGVVNSVGGPLRTGRGVILRQVLRTDAAARPGTSGGAIVDASGGVIAMTTSGLLRGLPVGIPIEQLAEIVTALSSSTPLKRAYLGVSVQPVRLPKARPDGTDGGLLVFGVAPDGAADRAGLLVGDLIVGFNDSRLAHADDLQDRLAAEEAGASATLSLIRGGGPVNLPVTLGVRPSA